MSQISSNEDVHRLNITDIVHLILSQENAGKRSFELVAIFGLEFGCNSFSPGLMPFVCRIQGVRGLFEVVVLAIFFMEIPYQPHDSKNDEAKGNQRAIPIATVGEVIIAAKFQVNLYWSPSL